MNIKIKSLFLLSAIAFLSACGSQTMGDVTSGTWEFPSLNTLAWIATGDLVTNASYRTLEISSCLNNSYFSLKHVPTA